MLHGAFHARKKMDKEVFQDEKVANALQERFIMVRIQMDKTNRDNAVVKKWYKKAKELQEMNLVNSYPTCLFLIHKEKWFTK